MTRLQRVCIVAEHASIRFGGEAALPFHIFRELRARDIDAHLIVHERTREELLQAFPDEDSRLHFVRDTGLHRLLYGLSLRLPRRISEATLGLAMNLLTQQMQRSVVRSLVVPGTVVHQPIPVSPRFPSLIFDVGAPVVIGPMNGGMDFPPALKSRESLFVRMCVALGRVISRAVHYVVPGKRQAAVLLVANGRTERALPATHARILHVAENGVDLKRWTGTPAASSADARPRFLFMGRLVDWKALDIVLYALEQVPDADLDVMGDGPMMGAWKALAVTLGIGDRVTFHGWQTQAECAGMLARSTALVLPSLYECGGAVVLEAMAAGRGVIATDWGGPAEYLDAACGVLVKPDSREALISGFADAMRSLSESPERLKVMGDAGRAKVVAHFDWQQKADRFIEIYEAALRPLR